MAKTTEPTKKRGAQLLQAYRMTKKFDPKIAWILPVTFVAVSLIAGAILFLLSHNWFITVPLALVFGLLLTLIVFGRRGQNAALGQVEGKPGAAAAALGMLRRGWQVKPAVGFNKQQDVVTRVVGPPGVILIGEGNPGRLKALLTTERRRHERVLPDVPIQELILGDEAGQVPLRKVARYLTKQKRQVKPAEITDILARLKAIDASRSVAPLPKGPMPTPKGTRQNMRGR